MSLARKIRRLRKGKEETVIKGRRSKMLLEPLEPRILLSDFTYSAAVGAAIDATLRLDETAQDLQLINNADQSILQSQAFGETEAVVITGADLDDSLTVDYGKPFSLPIFFADTYSSTGDKLKVVGKANEWRIAGENQGSVGGPGAIDFLGVEDLFGGADADMFIFELGGRLDGFLDGGEGTDTLEAADEANVWEILSLDSGSLNAQLFASIENLIGGADQDIFVLASGAGATGAVDGGAGEDTLDYSAYAADVTVNLQAGESTGTAGISNIESLKGGSGDDTLVGPDVDTTWNIEGTDAGQVAGIDFSGFENLRGGAAADVFVFADGAAITGMIDGGGGINALDYSAYSTDVNVNLGAGTATGAGGISNIQNVTGGAGNDALTGDASANVLAGGAGDDILSGGLGADALDGGLGADTLAEARDADLIIKDTSFSVGPEVEDLLASIEKAVLSGGASDNTIDASGFTGSASLAGQEGEDTFILGFGNYTIEGGAGNDRIVAPDSSNSWEITDLDAGTLNGNPFSSIENMIGGMLDDNFVLLAGALATGLIDGREGRDTLKGADATNNWIIEGIKSGKLNGKPFNDIENLEGGAAEDTLTGPSADTTWNITGPNSGSVSGVDIDFFGMENLSGAADNEDTFSLLAGGQITGGVEGGAGGFDILEIVGDETSAVVYTSSGPSSGSITIDGLTTTYSGFEPATITPAANVNIVLGVAPITQSDINNIAVLTKTSTVGTVDSYVLSGGTFEDATIQVDSTVPTAITINLGTGTDQITISGLAGTNIDGKLTVLGGDGDDTFILGTDYGALTLTGGAGTNEVTINASGETTVAGGTITSVGDGVATLSDPSNFDSISGSSISMFSAFALEIDQVFGKIGSLLAGVENLTNLAQSLPLIGGSNLSGQAQVALGKAIGIFEAIDSARAQVIAEVGALTTGGFAAAEAAIEGIVGNIESLGAAVVSRLIASATDIQDAIASLAGNTPFSFDLDVVFTDNSNTALNVAVDLDEIVALVADPEIADNLEALVAGINQIIGANADLSGQIRAAIDDAGRLAFQVLSSEIKSLVVEANSVAGNLANTLLGYATDAANQIGQRIDDVASVLTALGDLEYSFSNVNISINGAGQFVFDFDFDVARQTEFAFDFGDNADSQGLSFSGDGKLLVGTGFSFDASIVMDTAGNNFTATVSELGAGLEIDDSSGVTVKASIGAVSGTASGTVSMNAGLLAAFTGGASFDQNTSADSLVTNLDLGVTGFNYNFVSDSFAFSGTAGFNANLTLTVGANLIDLNGASPGGTASATIMISGGNPFSGDSPTVTFGANFDSFFDFNNLTPTNIINTIANFIGWIEDATGSSLLSNIEIPFVEGGLDDLANLAQILSNALIFDFGGDNVRDGADKLLTDVNAALQAAGLDAYLRAIPGASFGQINLEFLDDDIVDIDISGSSLGGILANGTGLTSLSLTGLDLTGILSGALTATVTVNLTGGRSVTKEFSISVEDMADNNGLGDDLPKLLDGFNTPTFNSVQDFLKRLDDIGILGGAPINLSDLSNFYDPGTAQLTYEISITDKPIFDVELPADFELDLGSLLNVQSDTRLVLSGMGSVGLTLGFDITSNPLAGDLPGVSGDLSGTTTLAGIGVEPKTQPAVTGTSVPTSIQGVLTADAGFSLNIDGTVYDVVVESSATATNTTIANLVSVVNAALTAVFDADSVAAANRVTVTASGGKLVFTGGTGVNNLTITVASGDPALGAFGLQPTQSASAPGGGATITATGLVPTLIGVFSSNVPFQLMFTDSGGTPTTTYDVTVLATDTLKVLASGEVQNVNRNIIDLVADVQTALGNAAVSGGSAAFDLNNYIEVGFQGKFLVLTLKDTDLNAAAVPFDGFSVVSAVSALGLPAQAGNTDDLLIRFDNGQYITIDISAATNIAGVLSAINTKDLSGIGLGSNKLSAVITPDDPATPENEGGKSLTISYNTGSVKLQSIEATNGSAAATQLGIVGMDVNMFAEPGSPEATPDGSITGRGIGGVTLADRFFIEAPGGGSLENIASFEFDAQAGRLLKDLRLVSDDDVLVSDSVDLRDYVGFDIQIKNVNGFTAGTYMIDSIVTGIDTDGDGATDGAGDFGVRVTADLGTDGLAGGVGIIQTGVQASAALGFIEVELTGTADFQAEASVGLNTGNAVVSDGTVTLAEVIDLFEAGDILNLFRVPSITVPLGDADFGGVDLTLSIGSGSPGFDAIINDILPGNSAGITIDILALGDPFMKTRFDQAGGFSVTDADTFTVTTNATLTGLLIEGAKLRFTLANGDVFDAKMDSVGESGGIITVDLIELTKVQGSDTPALNAAAVTDVVLLPSANVTLPDIGAIFEDPFSDFGIDDILKALGLLVDFLLEFQEFDFLQQSIPVLDKSVADLLGMAQDLADYIDELRANPAGSLQFLEDAINDAIGLSSDTLGDIFDTVNGAPPGTPISPFVIGWDSAEQMLTLTLNIGAGFSEALNVGFSDMGFGDIFGDIGIDGILDFSGSAGLEASGGIFLTLGLGIDLDQWSSDPTAFDDAIYLLDTSTLEAVLEVGGTNLAFNAGLGPFALSIQNDPDGADAEISIEVGAEVKEKSGNAFGTDNRISIAEIIDGSLTEIFEISGANGASSFGTIAGTLPVFFPNDANLIGTIRIGEEAGTSAPNSGLGDLLNFGNLTFTTDADELTAAEATLTDGDTENDALVVDISELVTFFEDFDFSSFSLFDNIKLAVDGFDSFLRLLETSVLGALGDLNIPLVGPSFSDAADFIADFRVDFVGPLREAIDSVEDAADDFTDPDKNIISKLLFDLLGPDGLNLLLELDPGDKPGDLSPGLSPEDFILLDADALAGVLFDGNDISTADIAWDFKIGQSAAPLDNAGFGFDIGIPGLALRTEAEISATLGWELELGFGLSTKDGFYLDVENEDGTPELNFSVDVTPSGAITGELGFLALTAQTATRDIDNADGDDNPNTGIEQTGLSASFGVDLIDRNLTAGDDANRLGLTEFGDIGLQFQAAVEAAAVLDMTLGLNPSLVGSSVATGFPSVVAEFDFLWGFDTTFSLDQSPDFGSVLGDSLQVLAFNNVGLDLGEFVTEVLGPIVDAVSEFTAPLQPFIDFLTAPIPVIDAFGVNLTMLDLAAALGDFDAGLIENLAEIITLINTVADLRADAGNLNLVIPLGDFVLFDGSGQTDNPFADGFDRSSVFANRVASNAFGDLSNAVSTFLNSNSGTDTSGKAAKSLQGLSKPGGAFAFPILEDPTQVFGLLMGESPTLVTFDLEPLIVGFEQNFFFSIFGPLGVSLGLIIEFEADFAFGYDTLGIQNFVSNDFRNPLQLFDGFFISDTENPDGSGADVPELTFLGGITAAAELNLGIARAGVAGGLFIEILFDLFDPDNDGKVRIGELISNVENQLRAPGAEKALAPLAIFDVTGEIFARLFAFLKIDFGLFEIDKEFDIVDPITILDFEIDFFRPPVVATETDDGDLIINVGPFAEQRLLGNTDDFGETVTVKKKSAGGGRVTVEVSTVSNGFGSDSPTASNAFVYVMDEGGTLIIDGGAGDDHIFLDGWQGNEVVFDIKGGLGDDEIHFINSVAGDFNSPFNIIDGGAGADNIIGSNGRDFITGAAGDDIIDAAGGDDFVLGDQGDILTDSIVIDPLGNDGADEIEGGTGEDILIGGGGQDKLVGGAGDDLILGDGGQINFTNALTNENTLFSNVRPLYQGGVTGADAIGEGVADTIYGDDEAGSETGDDIIFASGGNDTVDAGMGADVVFGGAGFDIITGGDGPDLLFGDVGSILGDITPLSNSDSLTLVAKQIGLAADGASDTIYGGADNDLIFASSGNDTVDAGGGDDLVFGGAGADFIEGGAGNDDLRGESQGDTIYGDDVAGLLSGNDILNGGTGPDLVFGGLGDDVIISTKGSDIVNAGEGNDTYRVNLAGGTTTSFIDIIDGGTGAGDVDRLEVNGTDRADTILIRADASGANAFIAGINGSFNVERVNYGSTIERIVVNGGAGNDLIVSDDTAASIEVNGESGDDTFQVGQLFRTQRNVNSETFPSIDTGILSEDFFTTIEVTRGWLSNGISNPMTINGGIGNDNFTVYHNKAVLTLNGDEGDDIFEVRAFALAGSQEPQRERTDLSGGAGADLVRYAVNAPVNINGGDGFDTLIVIGTEFGDDFVITKDGVFGAGLNVNFVNIESLRVDGAEGDDRFFLQSTKDTVLTELFGGLGNDTFNASGDTPPVVSNDFRGHSGIITHEIESSDPLFNGQALFGISANVGDDDEPFAIITESQGATIVNEGDAVGDSYQIVLTQLPKLDVFVTVNAPLPSPSNREQKAYAFSVSSSHPDAVVLGDGSSVILKFTTANWNIAQTVDVQATTAIFNDFPSGSYTRTDINGFDLQDVPSYDFSFDDAAFEGQRNGVVTHLFSSGVTVAGAGSDVSGVGSDTITINKLGLSANDLLGRILTITENEGIGEFRFIAGVTDNGATYTLTLGKAWEEGKVPVAGSSKFIIRVDDAITGVVNDFTEMKAEEIFDDRSTFEAVDAAGEPVSFGSNNELIGRTLSIVGGPGAGQELLILSHTDSTLTLNGIWTVNPVIGESIFRIERYDGLNSQVVEVTINDNDRPGLIVDQAIDLSGTGAVVAGLEAVTAVIEGSDGDQRGEADVMRLRLTEQLNGTEQVTVGLNYDAGQIKVVAHGAGAGGTALTSVVFDDSILQTGGILVDVYAVDDVTREAAHTAQISFDFTASGFGGGGSDPDQTGVNDTLVLDIPTSDPQSSVGLNFKPDNAAGITVNVSGIGDLVNGTDFELIEGSNTILFLDPDGEPLEHSGIITINYTYTVPGFDSAFADPVLVRIADDDAPTVLVRETDGSTDVIEDGRIDTYELVLTKAPTAPVTLDLTEIITKSTKTGGIRHDLVQVDILGAIQNGALVTLTESDALDASGNQVFDSGGNLVTKETFTFDDTNWDKPLIVVVGAVDDMVVDGGDTKVFAPAPDTVSQILGPVVVSGAGGNGSLFGLNDPLMLPGEKNVKPPTGDILAIDNGDAPGPAVELEVSRADLTGIVLDRLRIRVDPSDNATKLPLASDEEIEDLIGKTIEITRAPAAPSVVDQFRLIIDVDIDDNGTPGLTDDIITFTLNEPYELGTDEEGVINESFDPTEAQTNPDNAGFPAEEDTPETPDDDPVNRYAITSESLNFFVNEEESVDFLFVHDGDSPADTPAVLTSNRLFGLNMGPNTVIGGTAQQGGITFDDLEVIDITLGSGYNDVEVKGTPTRSDGFQTWTIIRTGTEIADPAQPGVPVGDTVTVQLNETEVEIDTGTGFTVQNPSVVTAFTTLLTITDGSFYSNDELLGQRIQILDSAGLVSAERWIIGNTGNVLELSDPLDETDGAGVEWRIFDPADGSLSVDLQGGQDTLTAAGSTKGLVVFGGDGQDTITGGVGDDILFGDVGRVDYRSLTGAIVTRLGSTPEVITGFVVAPFPQDVDGDPAELNTNQTIFPLADTSSGLVGDPSETADTGLVGLFVDINNGTGFLEEVRLITANTNSQLTVDPAFVLDLDATSQFRISTTPEDQTDGIVYDPSLVLAIASMGGDDDIINSGMGNDVTIGGEGEDTIAGNDGDDVLFGDLGVVEYSFDAANNPVTPEIGDKVATLRSSIRSIELPSGDDDTISGDAGSDVIIGGFEEDDLHGDDETGSNGALDGDDIILGDAGLLDFTDGVLTRVETYRTNGAADEISGDAGSDIIIGGMGGDTLYGDNAAGSNGATDLRDYLLGDNGEFLLLNNLITQFETTDITESTGGADTISGNAAGDHILGGVGGDTIYGDLDTPGANDGNDVILGDQGIFEYNLASPYDGNPLTLDRVRTKQTGLGAGDEIYGNAADDVVLGGTAGDLISGNTGDDLALGDFGEVQFGSVTVTKLGVQTSYTEYPLYATITDNALGGADTVYGNEDEDVIVGGAYGDNLDGGAQDDLIFGDNVSLDRNGQFLNDFTNPRFREQDDSDAARPVDGALYDLDDKVQVGTAAQNIPALTGTPVWGNWEITLLDHDAETEADDTDKTEDFLKFGDDYIAGGAHDDQIFGQLGNDTIQGDGSIDFVSDGNYDEIGMQVGATRNGLNELLVNPSFEDSDDGDDYIEGNGGSDVIFGNLGQDDILGDNSSLFSLEEDEERQPAGEDLIFGGAGTDIARNDYGDAEVDGSGNLSSIHHGRDSDMILGDNGNILRLVTVNGTASYLSFNYDNIYTAPQIVVRAAQLLDYSPGGPDYAPNNGASTDIGARDEIHGESGDDFIYGMVGSDVLFGDGQDDDIIGGYGNDWISGGTGQDGVIGDDGRIYTSRNGTPEPLNAVVTATEQDFISTPGSMQQADINVTGELKKAVNLTPFSQEPGWMAMDDEFGGISTHTSDDIIYGGLGSDWLHGGSGDDAISGAEALPEFFAAPVNPGDVLGYDPTTGEFADYDEYFPLTRIAGFLLNFDETEGVFRAGGETGGNQSVAYDSVNDDGDDKIFGDLGNDWLVGGTGRDNIYGGWGDDLMNADDNHNSTAGTTDPAANNIPDTHPTYEDRAYGGAGRDVLIGNTGGDRLIDWVGEFNSYLVPFAPFGMATVSRTLQPQLAEFLYALSESDGADPTRAADTGAEAARNGEPFGELGVVRQKDFAWHDQTGAPDDPQAGNIPGGKRDVLRSASFDGVSNTALHGFYVDSGVFEVTNNALRVSAESLGGDATSVFHVDKALPVYFEIQASITMEKPIAGWKANSYVIFDYYGPTDFKFAGLNASIDKIQMGHRDASGWHVDVQSNMQIKPGTFYNMLVAVNGTNVTVLVDNATFFSYTFAPRVDSDGWVYGINDGMIGFGSDNSRGVYDNIAVKVLPPAITLEGTEEFPNTDGVVDFAPVKGAWQDNGGRYDGAPAAGGNSAVSLVDLGIDHGLEVASILELEATLNTQNKGGVIFDYYSEDNFKFAAIDGANNQLVIGHYTGKSGWVTEAIFGMTINEGADYVLNLSLKGTTVSAAVKAVGAQNWQGMVGYVFNAVTVDGAFGLLSKDGASSFDEVTVKTDDPAFAAASLTAAAAPAAQADAGSWLTYDQLDAIVEEAKDRWAASVGGNVIGQAALDQVTFQIVNFADLTLGRTMGASVLIDADAARWGWFVDETPGDDLEFGQSLNELELAAASTSPAFDRMDLLTVVMHEFGHVLGFEDLAPNAVGLMSETLDAGTRVLPPDGPGDTPLVVMDSEPAAGRSGKFSAAVAKAASFAKSQSSSWLMDFVVDAVKRDYNPFDPVDKIRINLSDDDDENN